MSGGGGVDARARSRLVVARAVLQKLHRKDFRSDVGDTNATGDHVIVPALPDDKMGQFFQQLRRANGTIYIATMEGEEVALLSMAPARQPKHAAPSEEDCPIFPDTDLIMVIQYLRARRAPLTCYEVRPVMLELVDEVPGVAAALA